MIAALCVLAGKLSIRYKCISYPTDYYYTLIKLNINNIVEIRGVVSGNMSKFVRLFWVRNDVTL